MLNDIFLAILQAATEFLPISSSGHLALASNLISKPNLFFFTVLHLSSLFAVIIFMRKEITGLVSFKKEYRKMWAYLIIATIPVALFGFFLRDTIERSFSSFLYIGVAYIFTAIVLFLTKFTKERSRLDIKNAFIIGLFQAIGLFPGVSRSGITISAGLFLGIDREKSAKFSFLLFIPLSLGAFILESADNFYFNASLVVSFLTCLILSIAFLSLLLFIVKKEKFWLFSIYCFAIGLVSLVILK